MQHNGLTHFEGLSCDPYPNLVLPPSRAVVAIGEKFSLFDDSEAVIIVYQQTIQKGASTQSAYVTYVAI
jgi:hypothetical protein